MYLNGRKQTNMKDIAYPKGKVIHTITKGNTVLLFEKEADIKELNYFDVMTRKEFEAFKN